MTDKAKATTPTLPPVVYAEASVRSVGRISLFDAPKIVTSETVESFYSESQLTERAVQKLRTEGFEVLHVGATSITIGAPPETYQRVFKTRIVAEERSAVRNFGEPGTATFLECPDTAMPGLIDTSKSPLADELEGVAINEPVYYHGAPALAPPPPAVAVPAAVPAPNFFGPRRLYWHLTVPGDVAVATNAERAHRAGFTGKGVRVVMVDSGWYRHPFFTVRGYRSTPVVLGPGAANADHDEVGHGTGESANIFAVAPDVQFTMVKLSFVNAVGGLNAAVALKPHIISCSWGSNVLDPPLSAANQALAAAVANAVRLGIIVVFSAANGSFGFPGQHPDVISAGGVYMREDGAFEATPYASGFASRVYPGRNSPDLCGLVGLPPRACYIMLPIEPGCQIDMDLAGGVFPAGDGTAPNDGWGAFSGTSAAAPQLAGVAALMRQACGRLNPAQIRDIMKRTARDVTAGNCSPGTGGFPATPGADLATGSGLVDAARAAASARFRCMIVVPPLPVPIVPPVQPPAAGGPEEEINQLEDMLFSAGR